MFSYFFFNDTATTKIYTLSYTTLFRSQAIGRLHEDIEELGRPFACAGAGEGTTEDRKSTRLNSSHGYISYAVFCLKKKKKTTDIYTSCTTPHSTRHLLAIFSHANSLTL